LIRHDSDYDDFFQIEKEQAQKQLEDADKFLKMIENYIAKNLS
jgi:uncharacterized protein (UPF0332 family)